MTDMILTYLSLQKDIVLQSKIINTKMYILILILTIKNKKYIIKYLYIRKISRHAYLHKIRY